MTIIISAFSQDFKHCRGKAKGGNLYGIPFISDCVGSPFHGPCTSPSKPVPCGDRTCRSTFVECLQELLHQVMSLTISYSSYTSILGDI